MLRWACGYLPRRVQELAFFLENVHSEEMKAGIEKAVADIIAKLKEMSIPVKVSLYLNSQTMDPFSSLEVTTAMCYSGHRLLKYQVKKWLPTTMVMFTAWP